MSELIEKNVGAPSFPVEGFSRPCRHVKDIHMTLIIMCSGDGALCVIMSDGGQRGLTVC